MIPIWFAILIVAFAVFLTWQPSSSLRCGRHGLTEKCNHCGWGME